MKFEIEHISKMNGKISSYQLHITPETAADAKAIGELYHELGCTVFPAYQFPDGYKFGYISTDEPNKEILELQIPLMLR